MISWWELPLHEVATFYETSDCTHQDGKAAVNSGAFRDSLDGWHRFQPHQWIRSMMYGPNTGTANPDYIHIPIDRTCAFQRVVAHFDSTSVGGNETQADLKQKFNSSSEEGFAGDLSTNWTHALPDASKKAGSSLYGDEAVGGGPHDSVAGSS